MKGKSILLYPLLPVMVFFITTAKAQLPTADSLLIRAMETDELLPMLIDSAVKNSPFIRRMTNSVAYASENLEMNKKNIFSSFLIQLIQLLLMKPPQTIVLNRQAKMFHLLNPMENQCVHLLGIF